MLTLQTCAYYLPIKDPRLVSGHTLPSIGNPMYVEHYAFDIYIVSTLMCRYLHTKLYNFIIMLKLNQFSQTIDRQKGKDLTFSECNLKKKLSPTINCLLLLALKIHFRFDLIITQFKYTYLLYLYCLRVDTPLPQTKYHWTIVFIGIAKWLDYFPNTK